MLNISKKKLFFMAFGVGFLIATVYFYFHQSDRVFRFVEPSKLTETVYVSEQIQTIDLAQIKAQGFARVIDFRPDGEAHDQPTSAEVKATASQYGMAFYYLPVPHGQMPESVVQQLQTILATSNDKTLLYCRSGKRATRAYALAQASLVNGPDANTILAMVSNAGHAVDDLRGEIERRIAERGGDKK